MPTRLCHIRDDALLSVFSFAFLSSCQERYKADISLAIQLLQCKPDSFVSQKVSSVSMEWVLGGGDYGSPPKLPPTQKNKSP